MTSEDRHQPLTPGREFWINTPHRIPFCIFYDENDDKGSIVATMQSSGCISTARFDLPLCPSVDPQYSVRHRKDCVCLINGLQGQLNPPSEFETHRRRLLAAGRTDLSGSYAVLLALWIGIDVGEWDEGLTMGGGQEAEEEKKGE
ncbi:uncharacterized protein JN550_012441 [Neoarthrinium moseri]|uniref:uncharacterized protein n=1 Tax=Neoarthrinium moseri TaxID=1658444 RepID=UPI001FDD3FA7|nr:uncharacterized protein JN550_012441 [Neoarthrinium moseri]KAI1858787.1 hypothetical protein JN550_012441 [Neoarthrinium moseri]